MKIGFVGLGIMGSAMAEGLGESDFAAVSRVIRG